MFHPNQIRTGEALPIVESNRTGRRSMTRMSIHPSRVVASVLFVAAGIIVAVTAVAVGLAKILVDTGMAVRPADAALLGDLTALLPFVIAFAGLNIAAAVGLLLGTTWAEKVGAWTAAVAAIVGASGLLLIVAGADPSRLASSGTIDGLTILATFTILYLAAFASLGVSRLPRPVTTIGAAA